MKFKTFRALLIAGAGVVSIAMCGGFVVLTERKNFPKPTPNPFVDEEKNLFGELGTPLAMQTAAPIGTSPQASADGDALRPMDREILAALPATQVLDNSGKRKDALRGAYKVNLYTDAGPGPATRLKIDLDRDDKWDEKWSKDGATWKRQVSSAENETYDREYLLAGEKWVAKGAVNQVATAAAAAAATPAPATAVAPTISAAADGSAIPVLPMHTRILERARQPISGDKVKDAFNTEAWKVNLYQDAGDTKPNRLKLDLDRDNKWDEKWTFEGDEVKRQIAPADDEIYTEEWRLRAGAWVRK